MRQYRRKRTGLGLLIIALALLSSAMIIGFILKLKKPEPKDPHEGQVYLYDGYDWIWMTPLAGVPVNDLGEEHFRSDGGTVSYIGDRYDVQRGVDVSEHQHEIDWRQAAASGLDFAYIRVGRRGYTEGGLFEDAYFKNNIEGAANAGLQVGVYFFSQAITVQEAMEEADFVLERIKGMKIDLPVVFDWEKIEDPAARTNGLGTAGRTDCARAFCETVKSFGYTPCVYFNRTMGYYDYDLTRLRDYELWFSLPELGFPSFYYAFDMWQYSFSETVPGIEGPTDMNLRFIPRPLPETAQPQTEK